MHLEGPVLKVPPSICPGSIYLHPKLAIHKQVFTNPDLPIDKYAYLNKETNMLDLTA